MTEKKKSASPRSGLWMVLLSGLVFGVMPSAVKACIGMGATRDLMVLVRYSILELVLLPFVIKQKNTLKIYAKHFWKWLALSVAGVSTPMFLYAAYDHLSTGATTTIHFLYPALVVLIGLIFFRQKITLKKGVCLGLCVVGILFMLNPGETWSALGILLAFASALTWALYVVFLDCFRVEGVTTEQVIFCVTIDTLVLLLAYSLIFGDLKVELTLPGWGAVLLVNLVIAVLGSLFFAIGVRHTDAATAAIASTLEPITALAVGIVFLHESLNWVSLCGAALVLTAIVLLAVLKEKKKP